MKRNQVDEILVDQAKRKCIIFGYICLVVVLGFISLAFFISFINKNRTYYVEYVEDTNLDYQVFLKNNSFFKDSYLKANKQYIASLIDYINADFDYKLEVEEKDIDYKYSYKIVAEVLVKDKDTNNSLYNYDEVLYEEKIQESNSSSFVNISKSLKIDYNRYNELIKRFVNVYDLDDAISTLDVKMYVNVLGNCDEVEDSDKSSVISLSIPLTTKTVAIDMSYDIVEDGSNLMICKKDENRGIVLAVLGVLFIFLDIISIVCMAKYVIKTRSAETIYIRNLKKILNNYKSYIQKVNNELNLENYEVLKMSSFNDLLEIRETIQEPILMVENKEKKSTYFFIPSKTKILYLYRLRIGDVVLKDN